MKQQMRIPDDAKYKPNDIRGKIQTRKEEPPITGIAKELRRH